MKTTFLIDRTHLQLPKGGKELALFSWMIKHQSALDLLAKFGVVLPDKFELTEHTNPDDPPDLSAFGLGFEVTEFPPNQSAIRAVYKRNYGQAMVIPPLLRTGRSYARILKEVSDPQSASNSLITGGHFSISGEIDALEKEFLLLLDEPNSKDIPGNDVLLLDQQGESLTDFVTEPAIKRAIEKHPLKFIRLVLLVRAKTTVQVYP